MIDAAPDAPHPDPSQDPPQASEPVASDSLDPLVELGVSRELAAAYRRHIRQTRLTADVGPHVGQLIERELRRLRAPGYELDPLTRLPTRPALAWRIRQAVRQVAGRAPRYSARFLCVDLVGLNTYNLDCGVGAGDLALRELAGALRRIYPSGSAYRAGGDEFVVQLGDGDPVVPRLDRGPALRYAVVEVDAARGPQLAEWVELFLDRGIQLARPEGLRLHCGDPPAGSPL